MAAHARSVAKLGIRIIVGKSTANDVAAAMLYAQMLMIGERTASFAANAAASARMPIAGKRTANDAVVVVLNERMLTNGAKLNARDVAKCSRLLQPTPN